MDATGHCWYCGCQTYGGRDFCSADCAANYEDQTAFGWRFDPEQPGIAYPPQGVNYDPEPGTDQGW